MTTNVQLDIQDTPGPSQAQQIAASELANPKYHNQPAAQNSATAMPTIAAPTTPPPPPSATTSSDPTVILVILAAIAVVLILVFVLRALGKPRAEKEKTKKKKKPKAEKSAAGTPLFDEVLVGAARHRRDAENAAAAGRWAEAIRERFRAVIATLDERDLLPERPERTADEAARDAGEILPAHQQPLSVAARAFDEVEYGEYQGSPEGYAQILEVDQEIATTAGSTPSSSRSGMRR